MFFAVMQYHTKLGNARVQVGTAPVKYTVQGVTRVTVWIWPGAKLNIK